jgi:hypothetical protein
MNIKAIQTDIAWEDMSTNYQNVCELVEPTDLNQEVKWNQLNQFVDYTIHCQMKPILIEPLIH